MKDLLLAVFLGDHSVCFTNLSAICEKTREKQINLKLIIELFQLYNIISIKYRMNDLPGYGDTAIMNLGEAEGQCSSCVELRCPPGAPGPSGINGEDGGNGEPGRPGKPGLDGLDVPLEPEPSSPWYFSYPLSSIFYLLC